jgi:hypothetical protein
VAPGDLARVERPIYGFSGYASGVVVKLHNGIQVDVSVSRLNPTYEDGVPPPSRQCSREGAQVGCVSSE